MDLTEIHPRELDLADDNGVSNKDTAQGDYDVNGGGLNAKLNISAANNQKIIWTFPNGVDANTDLTLLLTVRARTIPESFKFKNVISSNLGRYAESYLSRMYTVSGLNKKAVIGVNPETNDEILSSNVRVTEGKSITYKLNLTNSGNGVANLSTVKDTLPKTFGHFAWTNENVEMGSGSFGDFTISSSGVIEWKNVYIPVGETVTQYVTISFPSGDVWQNYLSSTDNAMATISNTLSFPGAYSSTVIHEFPKRINFRLQQGVIMLGKSNALQKEFSTNSTYSQGSSLTNYDNLNTNTATVKKHQIVSYYVFLGNFGNADLPLYDLVARSEERRVGKECRL